MRLRYVSLRLSREWRSTVTSTQTLDFVILFKSLPFLLFQVFLEGYANIDRISFPK